MAKEDSPQKSDSIGNIKKLVERFESPKKGVPEESPLVEQCSFVRGEDQMVDFVITKEKEWSEADNTVVQGLVQELIDTNDERLQQIQSEIQSVQKGAQFTLRMDIIRKKLQTLKEELATLKLDSKNNTKWRSDIRALILAAQEEINMLFNVLLNSIVCSMDKTSGEADVEQFEINEADFSSPSPQEICSSSSSLVPPRIETKNDSKHPKTSRTGDKCLILESEISPSTSKSEKEKLKKGKRKSVKKSKKEEIKASKEPNPLFQESEKSRSRSESRKLCAELKYPASEPSTPSKKPCSTKARARSSSGKSENSAKPEKYSTTGELLPDLPSENACNTRSRSPSVSKMPEITSEHKGKPEQLSVLTPAEISTPPLVPSPSIGLKTKQSNKNAADYFDKEHVCAPESPVLCLHSPQSKISTVQENVSSLKTEESSSVSDGIRYICSPKFSTPPVLPRTVKISGYPQPKEDLGSTDKLEPNLFYDALDKLEEEAKSFKEKMSEDQTGQSCANQESKEPFYTKAAGIVDKSGACKSDQPAVKLFNDFLNKVQDDFRSHEGSKDFTEYDEMHEKRFEERCVNTKAGMKKGLGQLSKTTLSSRDGKVRVSATSSEKKTVYLKSPTENETKSVACALKFLRGDKINSDGSRTPINDSVDINYED